jgi:hypothetical protein
MAKRKSVLTDDLTRCIITGRPGVHIHHVFGGPNRGKSEKDGFIIPLVPELHNMGPYGIHFNRRLDLEFKQKCQRWYENNKGSRENFISRYGKSWL